jgi:hypothetical protein
VRYTRLAIMMLGLLGLIGCGQEAPDLGKNEKGNLVRREAVEEPDGDEAYQGEESPGDP